MERVVQFGGGSRAARTRARLLRAARKVVARKGLEEATVLEITEMADVAFGSFYNHFSGKAELLQALEHELRTDLVAAWEQLSRRDQDPAAFLAAAVYGAIERVLGDPEWAWSTYRSGTRLLQTDEALFAPLARRVEEGAASGRFPVSDPGLAVAVFLGGMLAVLNAVMRRELQPVSAEALAAQCLLPLGVAPEEAAALARRAARGERAGRLS